MSIFSYSLKKSFLILTTFFILSFNSSTFASEKTAEVKKIYQEIQKKLEFYNKSFPEIQFVLLTNGEWEKSLQALDLFIGYQATNLDYEHPAELREELLFATAEKIRTMLINGIPSSYLFKTGDTPAASKEHVCVITLKPETNVLNNRLATQYFIDLPEEILASLPEEKLLDKNHHLDFIIDHEAFHCVDTFRNGGIPMSKNAFSTQHTCFMRESQADMFAIAMHIKRQRKVTPYVHNMMMMRGMTLLNGECQHDSIEAIKLVTSTNTTEIISSSAEDLVSKVQNDYKTIAPDYNEFVTHLKASFNAFKQLGIEPVAMVELPADSEAADIKLAEELVDRMQYYYKQFTGKKYPLPGQ